jgi:lysozyme family protein
MSAFERAFAQTLKHEGGYVDHPSDPGGATNLGVTIGTLSQHLGRPATKAEVRALTPEAVKPIYKRNYWDAVDGDLLHPAVAYALYDYAVNSGPKRATIAVQRLVGVADDGKLGPITRAAIAKRDPSDLVRAICHERLGFLRRLSTWRTFGKGWTRRVEGVEREALQMANQPTAVPPVRHPEPVAVPVEMAVPKPWYESKIKWLQIVQGLAAVGSATAVFNLTDAHQEALATMAMIAAPTAVQAAAAIGTWFARNGSTRPIEGTTEAGP